MAGNVQVGLHRRRPTSQTPRDDPGFRRFPTVRTWQLPLVRFGTCRVPGYSNRMAHSTCRVGFCGCDKTRWSRLDEGRNITAGAGRALVEPRPRDNRGCLWRVGGSGRSDDMAGGGGNGRVAGTPRRAAERATDDGGVALQLGMGYPSTARGDAVYFSSYCLC
jgi:hypothetical protein